MRKTLLAAAALAPLWILASQSSAMGQTTITGNSSTSVDTATDGSITINSGVTITPTTPNTAAVTVDSNASVSNAGTLTYNNVNNVVGIAIQGGFSGAIVNTGTINITESYAASDTNKDGLVEAPFASPSSTARYGVQLTGTAPFTGSITNDLAITIKGDNSYGISLEAPLTGALSDSGTITLTGDNGSAIRETAGVSGNVLINGAVTVLGSNSHGAVLSGAVGGGVSIYSAISSTDYSTTTRPTAGTGLQTVEAIGTEANPSGGSALVISGSVANGVFLGAPPSGTNTSDVTTDRDGDGIVDSIETTGSVTTFGAAPAMVVGGANNITIGGFTTATGALNANSGYGLILEGSVDGYAVYDNISSTALQIGGFGGTTTVAGGLRVVGSVEATGYGTADPTAIHIGAGVTLPTIDNEGTISAIVSTPNSTSTTFPAYTAIATGIAIDAGSTITNLINSGTISASLTADSHDTVSAIALVDRGGGISTVTNTGTISASFAADAVGATVTGTAVALANYGVNGDTRTNTSGAIALDLSKNTTGVTLVQQQPPDQVLTTVVTNGVPVVTSSTTAAASGTLAITTAVVTSTVTSGNTTTVTTQPISPSITGDIYLGNGPNSVSILAGSVTGALSMGSGPTAAVTIDNGAVYYGDLSYTGTSGAGLTLNVNNGTLDNSDVGVFKTAAFNVGALGVLYLGVDPANNRAAEYVVSGAATIASGAKLGLVFDSNAAGAQTYTVVTAGSLSVGDTGATLLGAVPYMFNAALTPNPAAGTVTLTISPKTPAQLGLNPSQSAALPATYQALTLDTPVQSAFLNQYTKAGFLSVYNQILPDYAGGTFQAANAASQAIGRATSESNEIENPSGSRGAWAQELFIGVNQGSGLTDGFRGGGFGFVGGVETGGSGLGAFGVTAAIVNTTIADPHVPGDSQTAMTELEVGGYWQGEFKGFVADARIGGGYTWMAGRREFIQVDSAGDITLDRKVKDNWNGYTASGRFGLAYKYSFNSHFFGGGWFIQPQAHIDTFFMYENAYNESEAQGGPALAMAIGAVNGNETSGTASILFGRRLGTGIVFRPELELGIRDTFSGDAGDTTARYISGGPSFTLTPAEITGAAGIARFKLKASSEYYELGFEAGTEVLSSRYEEGDMKLSVRVLF